MHKPVTILTGFLGAGKTTFLNHLLRTNEGVRYAIIENELGKQGIDHGLILTPADTVIELNNGCLCCTLNDDLYDILNELHERRDEFDEVIIEATGIADPSGLAQPFVSHPLIKKHFPLTGIVCLVDAELIEDQLKETVEAMRQITFSDLLLINKTDLVAPRYVGDLARKLQELNPLADVLTGNRDEFPSISGLSRDGRSVELLARTPAHGSHDHTEGVGAHAFTFDQPFDAQTLYHQLFVYLTFQSRGLYRLKGLIWVEGDERRHVIQSVGNRLDLQPNTHWESDEPKQSVVVVIGKSLPTEGIKRLLERCLSPIPSGRLVNQSLT